MIDHKERKGTRDLGEIFMDTQTRILNEICGLHESSKEIQGMVDRIEDKLLDNCEEPALASIVVILEQIKEVLIEIRDERKTRV